MRKTAFKKTAVNGIGILFFMLLLNACGPVKSSNCIDESKISTGPCTMEYNPVCGCDGKTYSNPCQAKRAGLTSWEAGKCADELNSES